MKRLFDILIVLLTVPIWLPIVFVLSVLVRVKLGSPIFFRQERPGLRGKIFRLIKFRTMTSDAEVRMKDIEHLNEKSGPIFKIRNDPRITRVGRWLRKMSVDELPQLVNVLLGDMSIVGPRPLSVRDASRMEEAWQKRRFSVKPGLTCLWQVSGRSFLQGSLFDSEAAA